MNTKKLTGREPRIVSADIKRGLRRLSLRRLGTMLNLLSPESVSLDAIREMLRSKEFYVRYNAATLLAKRADRESRLIIEDALKDKNVQTRASVARVLYGFSWFTAEPLIASALEDDDLRVREAVIYALCDMKHYQAYTKLLEILDNADDNLLDAAAFGLRETRDKGAIPVLGKVLKAHDPEIRVKGLEALGMSGFEEAIPIVRETIFDNEAQVQYAAVLSMLELAGEMWLDELANVISRATGAALEQILQAFFHASNYLKIDVVHSHAANSMLNALENAVSDDNPDARKAVIWSLAWLHHPRTKDILKNAYHTESNSEVKAHIIRVAAHLMSEVSEEILQDALNSPDEIIHQAAINIINERERTGIIATYDETAYQGRSMDKSLLLGRLD